ncbi:PIG-L deacetylase family protein [Actinomycetospora chiangmaiensis]|uniref:PIG-L deacetylase family protein n=1 Tax=Actinomycetospora chiangmaiensis TaxID=402650 RepID=UPI00036D0EBD|nr:PIG-L family deacetylase [Actinomycetospora chiangmaiensis]
MLLSPHLDDVVLSCGSLIGELADRCEVSVVSAFSSGGAAPHTRAARRILASAGYRDAHAYYRDRRTEDERAVRHLGAQPNHLGFADAPFRRRVVPRGLGRAAACLPELVHRYPTVRFDIARGRLCAGDRDVRVALASALEPHVENADIVFLPLAIGGHPDHRLVRDLGLNLAAPVVYYSDFPYNLTHRPDAEFLRHQRLRSWCYDGPSWRKVEAVSCYRSQFDGLFPAGSIPRLPETYWLTEAAAHLVVTGPGDHHARGVR